MKNEDFRALLNGKTKQGGGQPDSLRPAATSKPGLSFGRPRSFAPMAARSGKGTKTSDFSRQSADKKDGAKRKKVSRPFEPRPTSAGRENQQRFNDDEDDERAKMMKELTEAVKNEEIDVETYEKIRDQITGGDLSATHLVVGLDRQLLERIRNGEDVYKAVPESKTGDDPVVNADEALDLLAEKEVVAEVHERKEKQSERVLTKKDIVAQLKARRQAEQESKQGRDMPFSSLGERREDGSYVRFEVDDKGREVMVVTLPDGTVKRKVKKAKKGQPPLEEPEPDRQSAIEPHKKAEPREEQDVMIPKPVLPPTPEQDEDLEEPAKPEIVVDDDVDIFDGVEEYDPLAGLDESDAEADASAKPPEPPELGKPSQETVSPKSNRHQRLFDEELSKHSVLSRLTAPVQDPEAIAKFAARASAINASRFRNNEDNDSDENANPANPRPKERQRDEDREARLKRKLAELQGDDRDAEDMDLGFGGSRFDDLEDMEMDEQRVRLSTWGEEEGGGRGNKGGAQKRKRGPKRKKGDKNNIDDVMKVMEARKGG